METIFSFAFIAALVKFFSQLAGAERERRNEVAAYLDVIATHLEEIHKSVKKDGVVDLRACAQLSAAVERARDKFQGMVSSRDLSDIVESMTRAQETPHDIVLALREGRLIDERSSLAQLQIAEGQLRGIAEALRAPEPPGSFPAQGLHRRTRLI